MSQIEELEQKLAKKATFLGAVRELTLLCKSPSQDTDSLERATKRVFKLLSARYTSTVAWGAGLELFKEMKTRSELPEVDEWMASALTHTSDTEALVPAQFPAHNPTAATLSEDPAVLLAQLASGAEGFSGNLEEILGALGVGMDSGPPPASRDARCVALSKSGEAVHEHNLLLRRVPASNQDNCSVCLEPLYQNKDSKAKELPCKHLFHEDCVLDWLTRHNTCPQCRNPLESEKLHFDEIAEKVRQEGPDGTNIYA